MRSVVMKKILMTVLMALVFVGLSTAARAQDQWYHERDARYAGDRWKPHVFGEVRTDLDHIYSAGQASDKERERIERTKQELSDLQAKLDHGVWDNGHVNDVIDSLRKSADDRRLSERDRSVLSDDVTRIKELQDEHNRH
jgi:opacity protein-like surface antigen